MGLFPHCSSSDKGSEAPPPPTVIAHRGASAVAPENSIPAVEAAWEKGADAVEVDVRISSDDQLIVIHDRNTERTTRKKHRVAQTPYDSLKKLDAGSWFGPGFDEVRIPTLDSLMDHVPADKELLVEFKSGPESIDLLEQLLSKREVIPAFSIISFDRGLLQKAKDSFPEIPTYWVLPQVYSLDPILRKGKKAEVDGLNLRKSNFDQASTIEKVRNEGLNLLAWTVNDPAQAAELERKGVQGIVTDHPGKVREAIRNSSKNPDSKQPENGKERIDDTGPEGANE